MRKKEWKVSNFDISFPKNQKEIILNMFSVYRGSCYGREGRSLNPPLSSSTVHCCSYDKLLIICVTKSATIIINSKTSYYYLLMWEKKQSKCIFCQCKTLYMGNKNCHNWRKTTASNSVASLVAMRCYGHRGTHSCPLTSGSST